MKKNLLRIFSLLLAAATSLSITAAPLAKKSGKGARSEVSTLVAPASAKTASKLPVRPSRHQGQKSSVFASPSKRVALDTKAPLKAPIKAEGVEKMPALIGSVVNASGYGVYTVPTNSSMSFERLAYYANGEYGAVLLGDNYVCCEYYYSPWFGSSISFTAYDITTGSQVADIYSPYYTFSMTVDEATSTVYAIANIDGDNTLAKVNIDLANEAVTFDPLGKLYINEFGAWNALACDADGQLWGVLTLLDQDAYFNDEEFVCTGSALYKIDKNTGAATRVGDMGYKSYYASDATFDLKTGRMFWTVCTPEEEGYLTLVDTATGAASLVYQFPGGEDVTGLCVLPPAAEDGAPDVVTGLSANFTGASLSGTVEFKAPATLFSGAAASGELNYTVLTGGTKVAGGTTTYGADVKADVTLSASGFYTFTVYTTNAVGDSPKAETAKMYVGADTPVATSVTASYLDGVMTVTWLPVTETINGGFMDTDNVTYTVTRFPGGEAVATDIKATTFTENIAEPDEIKSYYYTVVVNAGGLKSQVAQSNVVTIGSLTPPFFADFKDDLCGFNVIDANGDLRQWEQIDGHARVRYNATEAMDDWLISPGLKLEAGKLYEISASFWASSANFAERIEIKMGKQGTVEGMTTELLAPTEVTNEYSEPVEWAVTYIPETDGVYYIGFHGMSDKDKYDLFLDDVSVSAPKAADGPGAITDLKIKPGDNGALTADISFTTPAVSMSGKELTELSKIELYRGTTLANTWENPGIGVPLTYTDNVLGEGTFQYTLVAINSEGRGPEITETVYIGIDYPAAVTGVYAYETETAGEVTINWDGVTTTASGAALDHSHVTYQVYEVSSGTPVAVSSRLDVTSFTYKAVAAGKQQFVQYVVYPFTERGMGEYGISDFFPAGTPYKGLTLSNSTDFNTYIVGVNPINGGNWSAYDDNLIPSQDGDSRVLAMFGQYEGTSAELLTGLVTLEGMTNPTLSFYTYNLGDLDGGVDDTNELTVSVKAKGEFEFTELKATKVCETGPANQWNRIVIDLKDYAGKTIQTSFLAVNTVAAYTIIDNIKIGDMIGNDLVALEVTAPARATAGASISVAVTVSNEGLNTAEDYTVELYADGELIATKAGEAIAGGEMKQVVFDVTVSPFAEYEVSYAAKVVYAADQNNDNNLTPAVNMSVDKSELPAVTDLAGTAETGAVKLTWSEPDLAAIPAEAVTDDFEDGIEFASRYGEWSFVDMDESPVDGFDSIELPNIVEGLTKGSFWIWDTDKTGTSTYLKPHSGTKFLFSLYRADEGQSDEWAISPELNGTAQTIEFWAKSYHYMYPEKIKVWYSTGSTNPEDFVEVVTYNNVPSDWTLFRVELPAGAKRFAINSCATNAFMLMVDDVTYIPEGAPVTNQFKGYDVYRDGVKINDAIVEECEFTDANIEQGKTYKYAVVTVYSQALSGASNIVTVTTLGSGIDNVYGTALTITATRGEIIVTGAAAQEVAVYAIDGKTIFAGLGEAKTVIPAQQGVYVVKAGETVKKVIVK